jgi:hypothetical protein
MTRWDIFISHASEDKDSFVDPLARRLRQLAVRVWYDEFVLVPGDRLSEKIADGLAKSRCGLLIISRSFLGKSWPRYEMSGLVNRFVEDNARLIPVWLGVTRADVAQFNPALADLLAISASPATIDACALEVLRTVRPQLYDNIVTHGLLNASKVTVEMRALRDIQDGPIRHHDLPAALLVRIQNIWFATRDLIPLSLAKTIENFQRDLRPEQEVEVWERLTSALHIVADILTSHTEETRRESFDVLMHFCDGNVEWVFAEAKDGRFKREVVSAAAQAWLRAVPPTTVSDVEKGDV